MRSGLAVHDDGRLTAATATVRPKSSFLKAKQRLAKSEATPGYPDATPDKLRPSSRLSDLMRRIQAKANSCHMQFESFVKRAVTKYDGAAGVKSDAVCRDVVTTLTVPPVRSSLKQYLFPGPVQIDFDGGAVQTPPTLSRVKAADRAPCRAQPSDESGAEKDRLKYYCQVVKVATVTPATLPSLAARSSFKTWGAPAHKTRPDLAELSFWPTKHVTCIEVTLVNNQAPAQRRPTTQTQTHNSPMRTYCFGERPSLSDGDPSPCGTLCSHRSHRSTTSEASDQFDSGYEENKSRSPDSPPVLEESCSGSVFRSIFDRLEFANKPVVKASMAPAPKVQPKRSTIRREQAFRTRNKKAWSRAKESRREHELLERFQLIRQRMGEDSADDADAADSHRAVDDALFPLPSVVKTLVRQYNNGLEHRPREKIVPSRLNSKRGADSTAPPLPPPRPGRDARDALHQVQYTRPRIRLAPLEVCASPISLHLTSRDVTSPCHVMGEACREVLESKLEAGQFVSLLKRLSVDACRG